MPFDWNVEEQWRTRLAAEWDKAYFRSLTAFLADEYSKKTVYPPRDKVFNALNLTPFDSVKVVIIGQDPYHGPGQAHGLCFSVQKGVATPPSLRNMITELQADPVLQIPKPTHGNLECWARQGVLLLNTCLTVRQAQAQSHASKGWEQFTDAVVKQLATREGMVYLLWGAPAATKCKGINASKNVVITSSHPSPLSNTKTSTPFTGSRCFSRANAALIGYGKTPIDWSIKD